MTKKNLKIDWQLSMTETSTHDFVNFVTPSKEDKEIRNKVATSIEEVIKGVFPDCHVFVFGSCATGLNLPNSDIDLIVYQPDVSESRMITKVADAIVRQKKCKTIDVLKNTKVPLIKITDSEFGVNVDISFNRTNGVYCVKLVKQLLQMFPELKPLMMVLKCFLKSRQLNEPYSGGVGSFLLTMMVTSFLQRQYKLGNTNNLDLGKQLLDFFKLYGTEFNYQHVGISIRDGGFYYQKYKRGWEGRDERSYERLSVENPQDPEVDIGGSAFNIKRVQRAFQHAYDTLIYNNSNSVSILKLIITSDPSELNSGWKKQQK
eukprot:403331574